ncbi:MAG: DUF1573 domain-containing protein [Bacteroidia bacterium]
MKKILIIISVLSLCFISTTQAQTLFSSFDNNVLVSVNPEPAPKAGKASFTTGSHNFGTVEAGKELSYTFKLTNTGEGNLTIEKVKPSCSCTVSDYTTAPIEAGGEGYVKATMTPKGPGAFHKTVTVTFDNGDPPVVLTIKGLAE